MPDGSPTRAVPAVWIRRITLGFFLLAILLGATEAWIARSEMTPDGVQYLDNADALWSGDLAHAVSSQWNPLYPWLIGAFFRIFHPLPIHEFAVVHLLNFLIYLGVLAAFEYFLRPLKATLPPGPIQISLLLLGYSAFLCCTLDLLHLSYVTPDLLVGLFVLLEAGFLMRMMFLPELGIAQACAFGVTLGLGYWTKTPFLVYAFLGLTISVLLVRGRIKSLARIGLAAIVFLLIAIPYVRIISTARGRLTFGDSGRFNLIWMVNRVPLHHWQGGPADNGVPLHPTRKISSHPDIFEFGGPVPGTYPPWYDPIYWAEGAKVALRPSDFKRAILQQLRLYQYLTHHRQVPLIFAALLLFLLAPRKRRILDKLIGVWPLVILGVVPFIMYAPVHAEGRYLASFFVLLWTALFVTLLSDESLTERPTISIAVVCSLLMLVEVVTVSVAAPPTEISSDTAAPVPGGIHLIVARELQTLGLKEGDAVAVVAADFPYYWARIARAHVTTEVAFSPSDCAACGSNRQEWETARSILVAQGATFIVSPCIPGVVDQPGWHSVADGVFAYRLR